MAQSKEELKVYYLEKPYGILELIRHLKSNPSLDLIIGVEGGDQLTITIQEIINTLQTFQIEHFNDNEQIRNFSSNDQLNQFEKLTINFIRTGENTTLNPALREGIVREWQRHQGETTIDIEKRATLRENISRAEKYWQEKIRLEQVATQALSSLESLPLTPEVKTFIRINQGTLTSQLASSLESATRTGNISPELLSRSIIGMSGTQTWNTLEALLVRNNTQILPTLIQDASQKTASLNVDQESIKSGEEATGSLRNSSIPTKEESLLAINTTIEKWAKLNNITDQELAEIQQALPRSINASIINRQKRTRPWSAFFGDDQVNKILSEALLSSSSSISTEDVKNLNRELNKTPETAKYISSLKTEIGYSKPSLIHFSPLSPEDFLISKGADPAVARLFIRGHSTENIQKSLSKKGYSQQETAKILGSLSNILSENHGFFGRIQKLRVSLVRQTSSIRNSYYALQQDIENRFNNLAIVRGGKRIREALRLQNLPLIGPALNRYAILRNALGKKWSGFLHRNPALGYFLSSSVRSSVYRKFINNLAKNSKFGLLRLGATYFKNGGYSWRGFRREIGRRARVKAGTWLINQGVKRGANKLLGKIAISLGGSLVSGTLSGGFGFVVGAGLTLWRNRHEITDKLRNLPEVAAGLLKAFLPLVALLQAFVVSITGAIIGAVVYIAAVVFGVIASFSLGAFALAAIAGAVIANFIGPAIAWIQSTFTSLVSSITAAATTLGEIFTSILASALPTGAAVTTVVVGSVAVGWTAMTMFSHAQLTANIPVGNPYSTVATRNPGGPPASIDCFTFDGPWTEAGIATMTNVLTQIAINYPDFINAICSSPVSITRVNKAGGGAIASSSLIYIYNQGVNLYTTAHELGHVLDWKYGLSIPEFRDQGFVTWTGTTCLNNIYPYVAFLNAAGDRRCYTENFAETVANYIRGKPLNPDWEAWLISTPYF